MNKDEYDYRRDWKLPKGFPNDPETVANKNKVFYGIKGAENGWWYWKGVNLKHVPEAFQRDRTEENPLKKGQMR